MNFDHALHQLCYLDIIGIVMCYHLIGKLILHIHWLLIKNMFIVTVEL